MSISLHNADYSENVRIMFIFSYAFYAKLIPVNALKAYIKHSLIVWQKHNILFSWSQFFFYWN